MTQILDLAATFYAAISVFGALVAVIPGYAAFAASAVVALAIGAAGLAIRRK